MVKKRANRKSRSLLLIGLWINRNWILGNWIREIDSRSEGCSRIHWVVSVFANKHFWEKFVKFPLPQHSAYFFSYPTIFETYLKSKPERFQNCSIVNYTHNLEELGTLKHQAEILNQAHSVHFNCSADANALIDAGLNPNKIRLVLGAIDSDCTMVKGIKREPKTILLASRFSERKGVNILPEVVQLLPGWKFIILGRGWEGFLKDTKLAENPYVQYQFFNKVSRNIAMSRASLFLSLSKLEGGPIPLIESMSMGLIPVATDTGFARDVIIDGNNGIIIPNPPTPEQVQYAIYAAEALDGSPEDSVKNLNWDRLAKIVMDDAKEIWNRKN